MDENSFKKNLFEFLEKIKRMIKSHYPQLSKKEISLFRLYNNVVERGGYQVVCDKKLWKEVSQTLDVPSSCTSATYSIRIIYEKFLYEYEQVHHFGKDIKDVEAKAIPHSEHDHGRKRNFDQIDSSIQYTKKRKSLSEREVDQIRVIECSFESGDVLMINYSLNMINSRPKWFWEHVSSLEGYLMSVLNDATHLTFDPSSLFNEIKRSERVFEENAFLTLLMFLQLSREKIAFDVNALLPIFSIFYKNNFNEEFKDVIVEIVLNCAKHLKPICEMEALKDLFVGFQASVSLETVELMNAFLEEHNGENNEFLIAHVSQKTLNYVEMALDDKRDAYVRECCLAFLLQLGKIDHFKSIIAGGAIVYRLVELMEKTYDTFHHQLCGLIFLEIHSKIDPLVVGGIMKNLVVLTCTKTPNVSSILSIVLNSMK